MPIPYEVKKKLTGGYAIHYGGPQCAAPLVSALNEAGARQPCPTCGHPILVPGDVEAREIKAKQDAEKAQKEAAILSRQKLKEAAALSEQKEQERQRKAAEAEKQRVAAEHEKELIEQAKRRPYQYHVNPFPRKIGTHSSPEEVASYVKDLVHRFGGQGWEFFRIDHVEVDVPQGCIGALMGHDYISERRSFITFRSRKLND
jgi:uncharacterized Zn finger protein (UPF0148 family)